MSNRLQKALKLELDGKHQEAASLYLQEGKPEKASFLYQKAGNTERALEILKEALLWGRAADMCFKLERYKEAGEFYEKAQDYLKATESYEKGNVFKKAAELYTKIKQPEKAARMYLKAGDYLKAGNMFEQVDDMDSAILSYRRYLVENTGQLGRLSREESARIARIFEKAGEPEKAVELMVQAGEYEKALHLKVLAGDMDGAKEIYFENLVGQGFHLLSLHEGKKEILERYGKLFLLVNDPDAASVAFERAEMWDQAAEAYEAAGNVEQAAEYYFRCENLAKAAELYVRSSRYGTAADLYYKLKRYAEAAENYEKEEDYYKAGRLLQYLGQNEKAVSLLQRIQANTDDYMKATGIIAQAFIKMGLVDLARKRIEEVLDAYTLTHDSLDFFQEIAAAMIQIGDRQRSRKILEDIISIDFARTEARDMLMSLKDVKQPAPYLPPQAPPPPPAATAPPPPKAAAPRPAPTRTAPEPPPPVPSEIPAPPPDIPLPPPDAAAPPGAPDPQRMTKGMTVLKKIPFFSIFNDDDIHQLWDCISREQLKEDTSLVVAGRRSAEFYLLIKGRVEITSATGLPLVSVPGNGWVFGLIASLAEEEAAVTMKVLKGSAIIRIRAGEFIKILKHSPTQREGVSLLLSSIDKEIEILRKKSVYHEQAEKVRKRILSYFRVE